MKNKSIHLIISFICIFLVFLLNINSVLSSDQEDSHNENNPSSHLVGKANTIRMGVRLPSELFGKIRYRSPENSQLEGYCINLGQKLATKLNRTIEYQAIANDDAGDKYKRYQGLRDGLIDLECGPNTIFEPLQPSEITEENKWKECIVFSDDFYTTDIKLLLKKDDLEELEVAQDKSDDDFFDKVNNIGIEVVQDTTTYLAFKNYNSSHNSRQYSIRTYQYEIPDKLGQYEISSAKTRYEVLSNLDKINNTAYASDLPILQTILEQGFINKEYTIFPREKEKLLPGFEDIKYKQKYGIAFCSKANLAHIGKNIDQLKADVSTIIRNDNDLNTYLDTRSTQIERKISLVQDFYENKSWEGKSTTEIANGTDNGNQNNYLTIFAFICFLLITIYSLYLIFNDSRLRELFLSQFIVVIIGLFTGLVPLLIALLEGK